MQIIQERIDLFVLKVVPNQSYGVETERYLRAYFSGIFQPDTDIKIELAGAIQPEKSGKFRFSICRVAHN
jgi:phenylacetate-CoA ligase